MVARAAAGAAFMAFAVGLGGACYDAPTEVRVVVNSDLAIGAGQDIDLLRIYVEVPVDQGPPFKFDDKVPLTGGPSMRLPATLALVPASDSAVSLPFRVVAVGQLGSAEVVRDSAVTSFVPDRRKRLDLFLRNACRRTMCSAGKVCAGQGTCRDEFLPGEKLPDVGVPSDAAADAGADRAVEALADRAPAEAAAPDRGALPPDAPIDPAPDVSADAMVIDAAPMIDAAPDRPVDAPTEPAPVCPAGSPCDDGNPCTVGDKCDVAGQCVPGSPKVCASGGCYQTAGTCGAGGVCQFTPLPLNAVCSDGNVCTKGDTCDGAGTCRPGPICPGTGNPCRPQTCQAGNCVARTRGDGESCGPSAAQRCCGGACVDISSDRQNCGGCGTRCQGGNCESVGATQSCNPSPGGTSGRCTCTGTSDCSRGQICRTETPANGRCTPESPGDCAPGQNMVNVNSCPNYCRY